MLSCQNNNHFKLEVIDCRQHYGGRDNDSTELTVGTANGPVVDKLAVRPDPRGEGSACWARRLDGAPRKAVCFSVSAGRASARPFFRPSETPTPGSDVHACVWRPFYPGVRRARLASIQEKRRGQTCIVPQDQSNSAQHTASDRFRDVSTAAPHFKARSQLREDDAYRRTQQGRRPGQLSDLRQCTS